MATGSEVAMDYDPDKFTHIYQLVNELGVAEVEELVETEQLYWIRSSGRVVKATAEQIEKVLEHLDTHAKMLAEYEISKQLHVQDEAACYMNDWLDMGDYWSLGSTMYKAGFLKPDSGSQAARFMYRNKRQDLNGLSKREIMAVEWPLLGEYTMASLDGALSTIPLWLQDSIVQRGKPGRGNSALWNPAMIGICLVIKGHAQAKAITPLIRNNFGDWLLEWNQYLEAS
jgi:hypothetical protein